jgi:predicted RND superfamily exporter protein
MNALKIKKEYRQKIGVILFISGILIFIGLMLHIVPQNPITEYFPLLMILCIGFGILLLFKVKVTFP